jgi:predicted RNA-binding Zn-ribbon protein involved in translation (DUF1610 family)
MDGDAFVFLLFLVGLGFVVAGLMSRDKAKWAASQARRAEERYCPQCGTVAGPEFRKSGSTSVEVLLWLFFLVPGVIYSIWRKSTERFVCPKCEQTGMIPLDSPNAQAALKAKAATTQN